MSNIQADSTSILPRHVGIIMDGNGRWAKCQGKNRTEGHLRGLETVKSIVGYAAQLGLGYLSLYAFSTENWKRTADEVKFLMNLVVKHLRAEYEFYKQNRIRVVHSGDLSGLPATVQTEIREVGADTASFDGLTVNIAINYGGRNEILRACQKAMSALLLSESSPRDTAELQKQIHCFSENDLESFLDQPDLPPLDLIIRTSGEKRISNFMLWQSAYAELHFNPCYWPDFSKADFDSALTDFANRRRRFGACS